MMHTDEKQIALMVSEIIGADTLIDCYFSNDGQRIIESLESKLGKDVTSSVLGKTAINSRTRIMDNIQDDILKSYPLETNRFDFNIDYEQQPAFKEVLTDVLAEEMPVIIESRVR